MATQTEMGREPGALRREFLNPHPLFDEKDLPPLTPEDEKEIDRQLTETPGYKRLMEICRGLKVDIIKSSTTAIEYLERIEAGEITQADPERMAIALAMIEAGYGSALAAKEALDALNRELVGADLPVGDCSMSKPAAATPAP